MSTRLPCCGLHADTRNSMGVKRRHSVGKGSAEKTSTGTGSALKGLLFMCALLCGKNSCRLQMLEENIIFNDEQLLLSIWLY